MPDVNEPGKPESSPDEGSTFVPLGIGGPRPPTAQPAGPSEITNLVTLYSDEEQKKIAAQVCRDYDGDVKSREPRMRKIREYYGLYASVMKAKNFPFQNAANVNLPVLTYPMLQVQGRLFDMLWPANGKVLYAAPTSLADITRANAAETFANAYIRDRMPEMAQGLDDTLHQVCINGSAFRRTYWNAGEGRVCSDWIPIEDFVVAHSKRSQDPSMRDVQRYTMVQHLTMFDLEALGDGGTYANVDKVKAQEPERTHESELVHQLEKIDGSQPATDTTLEDKPRQVLEQHRTLRLPNKPGVHAAFDGKPHAVIVTVDEMSETVLSIVVREEPDPADFPRLTRETQAYDQHMEALQSFTQAHAAAQTAMETARQLGVPLPPDFAVPQPPPPPKGLAIDESGMPVQPKPQRMREICFFTHYRAFPSEGFYGLGFGDFLAPLNKGVNALINQHIDGVTLRNAKPGFISKQMKGQRGTIELRPGMLTEVDAPSGSIKDGIAWMDSPLNDPTTMPLVEMLLGLGDKLVASSDLMSGQTSGANRTAKETQILAEQAMAQITVLARRIKEAFRHELDKIWRCWGVFLPDEEVVSIVGDGQEPTTVKIGRDMFRPDARVIPAADPRTKTQRVDESTAVYQLVTSSPYINQGLPPPQREQAMALATEDMLRSLGAERYVKLVQPPPPPPPGPPPPRPYWAEDADFLRGKDSTPNPADDDSVHIAGHMAALNSPAGAALDKKGRDMAEHHIRLHHAQRIDKGGIALGPHVHPALQGGPPMPMPQPQNGAPPP